MESAEAGTLRYMAPEVITGRVKVINPSFDIWSMGCILYLFLHGYPPFDGKTKKEILDKIRIGDYIIHPDIDKSTSRSCLDLLHNMLSVEVKNRYNIGEIMNHPWMTGAPFEADE